MINVKYKILFFFIKNFIDNLLINVKINNEYIEF